MNKLSVSKILILVLLMLWMAAGATAKPVIIKFATVAPRQSSWMQSMTEMNQRLQEETEGRVKFRFYAGGVQGDELDVLRKIRIGQLHAGGFTGVGLGAIQPDIRILDLPFLFQNTDEVDLILDNYFDDFFSRLEAEGYILLGWTEVGMVHFFSQSPIASMADIQSMKLWVWQGDDLARTFFQEMEISPIPLALTDVLTSFETGLINAAYASPYAGAVMQWHERVTHISELPVANASGAILISKRQYEKLNEADQATLLRLGREYAHLITEQSRRENAETMKEFTRMGLVIDPIPYGQGLDDMTAAAGRVRKRLGGSLYSSELQNQIEQQLNRYREQNQP